MEDVIYRAAIAINSITEYVSIIGSFFKQNQFVTISIGLLLLIKTSGKIVVQTFKKIKIEGPHDPSGLDSRYGIILGKCENVIIYILILVEGYTALALIFAGKAIVRNEEKDNVTTVYHLAGTMINTAYSILIAFIVKFIIGKITAFL